MDVVLDLKKKKISVLVDLLSKSPKESLKKVELVQVFLKWTTSRKRFWQKNSIKDILILLGPFLTTLFQVGFPRNWREFKPFQANVIILYHNSCISGFLVFSGYLKW